MKMLNPFSKINRDHITLFHCLPFSSELKKIFLFTIILLFGTIFSYGQLTTGDIAFTAFNADGDDDFAIVALVDIPANSIVFFTDNEPDAGGGLTTGEGYLQWNSGGTIISAGTIITFTDTDATGNASFGSSVGTLSDTSPASAEPNLAGGGDALFAYIGTSYTMPSDFLAGIQNEANNQGSLAGAGLTAGTTFVNFYTSGSPDGGEYTGSRTSESSFSDYLALIGNSANWTTETSNGENILPISTTSFSLSSTPNIITSTTSLTGYTYQEGSGPSAEQSFTVEGTNLTNDISLVPPTGWEISTGTGGSFSATNPITLIQTGGVVSTTTIYTRMASGLLNVNSPFSGNIVASSTGATTENIAVDGTVTAPPSPTIVVSPGSLTGYTYVEGSGPSTEQSFTVEGNTLTNDISLVPPTGWEISTGTGGSFSATNPITLTQSGGTVATTTIYTRMVASLLNVNSPFSGNVVASSTGASSENIAVDGTVTLAPTGCSTVFSDDFSSGLTAWSNTGDWTTLSNELKHGLSGVSGSSYIYNDLGNQNLATNDYEWEVCISNGNWDPSGSNKFAYFLISDALNLLNTPDGYAVGVNQNGTSDLLELYSVNGGTYTSIITTSFDWAANDDVCIRVTRTAAGAWELLYNDNGAGEVSGGTTTNTDFTSGQYIGQTFTFSSSRAGLLYIDDITVCGAASPTINTSISSLTGFTYVEGSGPSAEQSFTVDGINLTNDIDITPPTGWEISTGTGGSFVATNPITLTETAGVVSTTTIYTRMASGLLNVNSPFSGNIVASSTGAATENIAVDGTVTLACVAPTNQATALAFSNITSASLDVAWTASSPISDNYLVVQSTSATMSSNPVDASTYVVSDPLGGGTVVFNGSGTSFTDSGLSPLTTYYYFVFAYNDTGCTGGPLYKTPALVDNETTLTAPDVVITEYAGRGLGGSFHNEYFELVNFDATAVNLSGWTLEYYNSTVLERTENLSGTIAANSAFVIAVRTTYTGALSPDYVPSSSFSMNSIGYVILKQGSTIIDQAGSTSDKFSDNKNYEFTDCLSDNLPTANWDDLGTADGTPGVVNCACTPPATQATVAAFSNINPTTLDISWTAGSGTNSLVVITEGGAVSAIPSSGTSYTADTTFGSGDDIGTAEYVLYNGTGTSTTVTGLSQGLTYHIAVYSFNSADDCYNIVSASVANETTSCGPTPDQVTNFVSACGNGEATLTWDNPNACFDNVLIFASETTCTSNTPTGNGGAYSPASTVYGSGDDDLETGVSYLVYKGTGSTVTVTGLTNGQSYCFKIFTREASTWSAGVEASCAPSLTYCTAGSTNSSFEYIQQVDLNTISNSSGASTYTDFTSVSTTLERGESYDLSVYVGDFYATDSCLVWVDWDFDGTFDPVSELVYEGYGAAPFTGSISVPVTASLLTTRMRVRLYDDGAGTANSSPCGFSTYGEVEDYNLTIIEGCVPVHTVSTYLPTAGPELTEVTITGNSFTPTTTVNFDGVTATVTYIDATTLIAEVPAGATTGDINVVSAGCDVQAGIFTITEANQPCFGTSSFTDVIISEVYDSDGGNVAYIELYNPTGSDIDLDAVGTDYVIKIDNIPGVGINRTIDLTGTIVAESTFLINLGTSSSSCGLTFDFTSGGSGFNADDYVYLEKSSTDVDRVNLPNQTGFSVSRLGTATGPTTTYDVADWDIALTESCAGLGTSPISPATPPSLTTIVDQNICSPNFSVTATAGGAGAFTYIWYYSDGTAGWSVVNSSNLSGLTLSGETTASLTLSANTAEISTIDGYQFYVEVTEDGNCVANSNAAQYTDPLNCIPCVQLFISEYGEPSTGDGKYIEIYNPTSNNVDLSNYEIWGVINGGTWSEFNIGLSGLLAPFDVYVIANNATDVPTADQYHVNTMNFNGDDAVGLAYNGGSGGTFTLIDVVGEDGADPGTGWDVAGTTDATVDQTLRRKSTVQAPNTDWTASAGTNTTNSEWEVLSYTLTSLNAHTGDCGTNSETIVSFDTPPSITKDEDDPSFTIPVTIYNPDASATSVDVVLISGSAALLNSYTTQSVTFPGGSGADQTITITLTDDMICNGVLEYVFELQNVSGGNGAIIGANTTFTLTVIDDETGYDVILDDNFDDNDISDWVQTTSGEWASYNGTSTPAFAAVLNGSHSMRMIADNAPADLESFVYYNYDDCMPGVETTWSFQLYNNSNPSLNNYFYVYLTNSSETATQTAGTGYAIGVRPTIVTDHDYIELYKIVDGAVSSTVINTGIAWQSTIHGDPYLPNNKVGVQVTRDANGLWEVKLDTDGGFNNLVTYGTPAVNTDFDFTERFGVYRKHNVSSASSIMIDDVRISQTSCSDTYYSQATGNFDASIWADQPVGTAQTITSGKFTRLVIQDGHTVTLNQDVVCDDLTTSTTGVLDAQDKHICINGDFLNTGTFTPGTSRMNFNGKGIAQILFSPSAVSFYDIAIDNPVGVTTSSEIDILNAVYPEEGIFNISAADLTLKSDATGTGSIAEIKSGASISGDITMERYVVADLDNDGYPGGWVGLSNYINGKTVADWNNDLITTGFTGSDYPTYAYPNGGALFNNIIKWDPTMGAGGVWVGATGLADNISTSDGYFIYMQVFEQNISMTGTFLQGSTTKSLSNAGSGWNLITNPYPCPVDWDEVYNAATNIGATYYVYDSDAGVYINHTAGSSPSPIAASQSFWVSATNATSSVSWSETQKVVDGTDVWERDEKAATGFEIVLNQNQMLDNCYVGFDLNATENFDADFDRYKMNIPMPGNSSAFVYTTTDDIELQNNINGELFGEISIPVLIEVTSLEVEYSLSFEGMSMMEDYCVILEDTQLGTFTQISENSVYNFITEENTDRFVIHISAFAQDCFEDGTTAISELDAATSSLYVVDDAMFIDISKEYQTVDLDIINELGQVVVSSRENFVNGNGVVTLPNLSKGIYIVRLKDGNNVILSEKIFR